MIGGIVANNASGMCCGVAQNSYHTLAAMTFVLADGTTVDTAAAGRRRRASPRPGPTCTTRSRPCATRSARTRALVALVRRRVALKNTTGYALAAVPRPRPPGGHRRAPAGGIAGHARLRGGRDAPHRARPARARDRAALLRRPAGRGARRSRRSRPRVPSALEIMDAASLRSQAALRALPCRDRGPHRRPARRAARAGRSRPRRGGRARARRRSRTCRSRRRPRSRATRPRAKRSGGCARASSRRSAPCVRRAPRS